MTGANAARYAASDRAAHRKALLGGILGNLVEFHDFAIYGLLAATIARLFFPGSDPGVALLAAFLVYATSFVIRPLGGIVLGRLGDRWGRLRLLALTIVGMSVASGLMAVLPTYAVAGPLATVLLVACRLAQGFFAGGEFAGATAYIVEHGAAERRAQYATMSPAAAYVGTSFGLLLFTMVSAALTEAQFDAWGWRLLFAIALPLGLVGAWVRYRLEESPEFKQVLAERANARKDAPGLADVVREQWRAILVYVSVMMSHTLPNYLAIGFFATYLNTYVGQSQTQASLAVLVSQIGLIFTTLAAGRVNDRLGRTRTLVVGCVVVIPLLFVAFAIAGAGTPATSIIAGLILVCSFPLISSGMAVGLVEMFPVRSRVTAGSIGYNLGTSLFGGTAPLVATFLIERTGSAFSVVGYTAVIVALTLVSVLCFFRRPQTWRSS